MARTVRDAKLDSRSARDKLEARARPHFKMLVPGALHLGYRRRRKGKGAQGRWLVRRYVGLDAKGRGRYREKDLGLADDFMDANGRDVLSFEQAQALALEWRPDGEGPDPAAGGKLTVKAALDRYFDALDDEGKATQEARQRAALHILPGLGSESVERLTAERLRRWLAETARLPPRVRRKAGDGAARFRAGKDGPDADARRRRQASANRVLTILKAALNHAYDEGLVKANAAWGRRLKPFRGADVARTRFLSVAEARRLANACPDDAIRNMVKGALVTGARRSELARLIVSDFNEDAATVAVRQSKSGHPRHVALTDEGAKFFKSICAGRDDRALIFTKRDGTAWHRSEHTRPFAEAAARAKISGISFHGLRHTYCSLAVMAGVPLPVLAKNLGHADQRMIERVYGHLSDAFWRKAIRQGAPTFQFERDTKVTAIR